MTARKTQKHSFGLFSETFAFDQAENLLVSGNGPISIKGANSDKGSVTGVGAFKLGHEEQRLHIHAQGPVAIKTPHTIPLHLRIKGPVKVENIEKAKTTVHALTGPLVASDCASMHLQEVTGPLSITHISGNVLVDEVTGPSFFKEIDGDITISLAEGPVSVDDVRRDIAITSDEEVFIRITGNQAQTIRVRSDDDVYLVMPAAARVEGDIQADGEITVELEQQTVRQEDDTITLTPFAGDAPLISVDIQADGDVYLGPKPPVVMPRGAATPKRSSGWNWGKRFLSKLGIEISESDDVAPAAATEPGPVAKSLAQEQEMILRMVAEGKITAEEGHQLLEALQSS